MRRALALAPALALALALAIASPAALPLAATAATPVATVSASAAHPELSSERVTLTTDHGDITLAFYPRLAPKTCEHIYELFALGLYDTNHIFRVDRGFVAQIADVVGGRSAQIFDAELRRLAAASVPGEFSDVPHVRGTLSMGRFDDPNSGTSSFSMLLGRAAHLDHTYAVFGEVVAGDDVLHALEALPTRREGMFVMPEARIEIRSTHITGHGELHERVFGARPAKESVNCSGVADAAYKRGVASASSVVAGAEGRAEAAEAQLAALRQESEDLARTAEASRASDARVAVLCALAGAAAGAAAARQLGRGAPRLSHVSRFKQSV